MGRSDAISSDQVFDAAQAHATPYQTVLLQLHTDGSGLAEDVAEFRRKHWGPNQLPDVGGSTFWSLLAHQFRSPLVYILILAVVAAVALGHLVDAGIVAFVLLLNAGIGVTQEHRAERSARALREMVRQRARLLREGHVMDVDAARLVPGDITLLESGDRVPADMRLIDSIGLRVDESLLTGESDLVDKRADVEIALDTPLADRVNVVHAGTSVSSGRAKGVVIATGAQTALGQIAASLKADTAAPPPLLIRMAWFARYVSLLVLTATGAIAAILLWRGEGVADVVSFTIALAVSAIPEGLPVALTVALSIAARRMSRRNVIVRRLIAVESLGSCTTIATDKTGTLTVNQLTAVELVIAEEEPWRVSGEGLDPAGTISLPRGVDETKAWRALERLAIAGSLCNEAHYVQREARWIGTGDTVDVALLVLARKLSIESDLRHRFRVTAVVPFEPTARYAAALHRDRDGRAYVSAKGAVEQILAMCSRMATLTYDAPLDPDLVISQAERLAADGLRVLAIAARARDPGTPLALTEHTLTDLTLLGLVGFRDPIRAEVPQAIRACHRAGLRVVMVTGDHPVTAQAVAHQSGIDTASHGVVTGPELELAFSLDAAHVEALDAAVFARIEPRHKLELVQALQHRGEFVAVTGDGVNDAPALHAAHVGIAMGRAGTDVAREASELVLADDNFASIVSGIEEGRVAYANIRKVITLLVSSALGMFTLILLGVAFDTPLPLLPAQILWLNLVANGIQDVGLAFEPAEGDELMHTPRDPKEPIFDHVMLYRVAISALYIGIAGFVVFESIRLAGGSLDSARNSALLLLVLMSNILTGASRSESRPVLALSPLGNPILLIGVAVAQTVHIAALYTPGVSDVLHTQPVSLSHWIGLLAIAAGLFALLELHKLARRLRYRKRDS